MACCHGELQYGYGTKPGGTEPRLYGGQGSKGETATTGNRASSDTKAQVKDSV